MPKISDRGTLMPDSPIRKLVPYSEKAIKKGITVYKLNIGQPDIHTAMKCLRKGLEQYSRRLEIINTDKMAVNF